MSNHAATIVQKLWNYCSVLRDDGLSYGDYVEQLTYLLSLKMAHERTQPPWSQPSTIPKGFDWTSLLSKDGDALEIHYRHVLETLGKQKGMLGVIFRKAQNKIQDPAKLRRLIADLIERESWSAMDADVKGTHGHLLRAGRQGERPLLRSQARERDALDEATLDLRPPDQQHFTLKTRPLKREDLDEFVACYNPDNRHARKSTWSEKNPQGRWRAFPYEELVQRDKASLDVFWLKDDALEDTANLPDPDEIAGEIAEDLRAALEAFEEIQADLGNHGR